MAEPLQPQSPAGVSILPLQLQGVGYCVGDQRVLHDINARFDKIDGVLERIFDKLDAKADK